MIYHLLHTLASSGHPQERRPQTPQCASCIGIGAQNLYSCILTRVRMMSRIGSDHSNGLDDGGGADCRCRSLIAFELVANAQHSFECLVFNAPRPKMQL